MNASIILADVGPNLGAINRSALISSDYVVVPLGADLFSLRGLRNLGPTLNRWRQDWKSRRKNWGLARVCSAERRNETRWLHNATAWYPFKSSGGSL